MDIRDIYKKYIALEEQATMTVTADSAEELASLLGIMKNSGMPDVHAIHSEPELEPCPMCGKAMSGHKLGSPCAGNSWDNAPDEYMQDLADITFLAGGGVNGPKNPGDIRVKDPRASENVEEWDNEPEEEYKDDKYMTHDLAGGINKAKKSYAAAQPGDNAIAVESIKDRLLAALQEKKKPDADGDGVPDWADKKPGKDDNEGKKKGSKPKKGKIPPQFKKKK